MSCFAALFPATGESKRITPTQKSTLYPNTHSFPPPLVVTSLLLLGTTTAGTLGGLDGLLVALGGAGLQTLHDAGGGLEGTLEIAGGGLAEDVDLDEVALEGGLEGDDGLDEEGVGVLHVDVHEGHHGDAHGLGAEGLAELGRVVGVDGGGDELALLRGAHWGGLDVLEGGEVCQGTVSVVCGVASADGRQRTLLLVDLGLNVEVQDGDQDVAGNVAGAAHVQDIRVIEGDLARDLDHAEHDDQVGTVALLALASRDGFFCLRAGSACDAAREALEGTGKRTSEG